MDSFQIFGLQVFLSFLAYGLIARWYVTPHLAALPLERALMPLLFTHCFRHLGMVLLVPQVVNDPKVPHWWAAQIGYGDLLAQLLAFLAIFALRAGLRLGIPLVWIFNVVGTVDLVNAYFQGTRIEAYRFNLLSSWYIPTFVVPLLLVTHYMMFSLLLKARKRQ